MEMDKHYNYRELCPRCGVPRTKPPRCKGGVCAACYERDLERIAPRQGELKNARRWANERYGPNVVIRMPEYWHQQEKRKPLGIDVRDAIALLRRVERGLHVKGIGVDRTYIDGNGYGSWDNAVRVLEERTFST